MWGEGPVCRRHGYLRGTHQRSEAGTEKTARRRGGGAQRKVWREAEHYVGEDIDGEGADINRSPTKAIGEVAPEQWRKSLDDQIRGDGERHQLDIDSEILGRVSA